MPKKTKANSLELSTHDKKIMGVAGGISEYYQVSPVWVRIVAIIFIVLTGLIPGLIIYFLVAAVISQGSDGKPTAK